MATLTVFWTPEESAPWLSRMAEKYDLRLLVFPAAPDHNKPFWREPPFKPDEIRNAFYMFFAPAGDRQAAGVKQFRDVNMRGWGWGCVRGGGRYDEPMRMLEKTEVIAENRAAASLKLDKCVTWLKRQLEHDGRFEKGVRITWTHLPGNTRLEPNYFFSQGAREEIHDGVVWVHNRGTSMIRFSPK